MPDPEIIDDGKYPDGPDGGCYLAGFTHGKQVGRVPGKDHGNDGDDPRVHDPEHRPAPQKPQHWTIRFTKIDINPPRFLEYR